MCDKHTCHFQMPRFAAHFQEASVHSPAWKSRQQQRHVLHGTVPGIVQHEPHGNPHGTWIELCIYVPFATHGPNRIHSSSKADQYAITDMANRML